MLIDVVLTIVAAAGFITGFRRGLIYSVFAFVALFTGLILAIKYSYVLSDYLYRQDILQTKFLPLISFIIIFLSALVLLKVCSGFIQSFADNLFLGTVNKVMGGLLWGAIMVLLYSTVLWYLDKFGFVSGEMQAQSKTYPFIISAAPLVMEQFSLLVPWFHGVFDGLENLIRQYPAQPAAPGSIQV